MKKKWVIGIDEVGRGPLAGPVYVCAAAISVSMYKKMDWASLTDSKKMTQRSREKWYRQAVFLQKNGSIRFALAHKSANAIDKKRINTCIRSCISEVLAELSIDPKDCTVFLDGGLYAPKEYSQTTIIKGDSVEKAISLASVIAKVTRDKVLDQLHKKHPHYGWNTNKGYGTALHYKGILASGNTPYHRKTYLTRILDKS